ncbi:MAG: hypothetical protein RMK35_04955, partial [Aquificaceae bacterium]|nr:hypothetical protein [Aquificaceae bacterium]
MSKTAGFALFLIGVLLFLFGQWIAFDIYANTKLSKINQNVVSLLQGLHAGESLIKLPAQEENIFFLRTQDGKQVTTSNTLLPISPQDYSSANRMGAGYQFYVYTKRFSLGDYLSVLFERPFVMGISLSGLVLLLSGIYMFTKEGVKVVSPQQTQSSAKTQEKEILKRLKALRASFALSGVIPQESMREAKTLLEDTIKKMEGKT